VDLLFLDPKEKSARWPFSQRAVQGLLKRVCKAAGLRPRNPHDLRHTYATTLLMAGVSPAYVQKQLGHHSISMTVDTYGHWVPGETCWDLDAALGSVPKPVAVGGVRNPHIFAYPAKKDEAAQAGA
jgi:integrase